MRPPHLGTKGNMSCGKSQLLDRSSGCFIKKESRNHNAPGSHSPSNPLIPRQVPGNNTFQHITYTFTINTSKQLHTM